jgi:opacity protein-like surface antigen
VNYVVNPWLTLRSSASWTRTLTLGNGRNAWGYSAGAGLDLMTSRHVVWTADYLFNHDVPAVDPASDTHTVTVGVKFKR